MNLVWKLLRQHISIPQLAGFFLANLFGMFIVLLGFQFYRDVLPVFTAEDSFLKTDYLVLSKKIGTSTTLSGRNTNFSSSEIHDVASQDFIRAVGEFKGNNFKTIARMGVNGTDILHSEIFLQSLPDTFVAIPAAEWLYQEGSHTVPIILPRTYINMYNFGFAQSRSLPKISDGLVGLIDLTLNLQGSGHQDTFKGQVIGFSNRLNEILVPEAFMDWANNFYAPDDTPEPNRLAIDVENPADERLAQYAEQKGYEIARDNMNAEKATYFLRLVISLVMVVGFIIAALSFYILMLSIYLLVQKNASKLENLLLIGYRPLRVALPYQLLTILLNVTVLVLAVVLLYFVRNYYMDTIYALFPQLDDVGLMPAVVLGLLLLLLVTAMNQIAIYRKIMKIWRRK